MRGTFFPLHGNNVPYATQRGVSGTLFPHRDERRDRLAALKSLLERGETSGYVTQMGWTLTALGPLLPGSASYDTLAPSARER